MGKKICVIGAGKWGENHIRTLHELGYLGAVVDKDEERLQEIKQKYNTSIYTDIDDAIKEKYNGYDVVTSAETHYEIGKKLINARCPLIIEKPMTMTSQEAKELVDLAKEKKVNFMVAHILLFHPAIRKIKDLIDAGEIGNIYYMYSTRIKFGVVRTEENVFESFAPHDLATLNYFAGVPADNMILHRGYFLQKDICDYVLAYLEYPNNIKGHIQVSWIHPFKEQRVVIVGNKGMIWYDDAGDKKIRISRKTVDFDNVKKAGDLPLLNDAETKIVDYDSSVMPLENELNYFVDHIDKTPEYSTGEDGYELVKALEKSRQ